MFDEQQDVTAGFEESQSDSSSDETTSDTSVGADAVTNDEVVSIKKEEWERMTSQVNNLTVALQKEREKTRKPAFSDVEETSSGKKATMEEYRKFRDQELQEERVRYEIELKPEILKKFPSIAANNDYGVDEEIVENYRDLLSGRMKRGFAPRTKEDVYQIFLRAIRISRPELAEKKPQERGDGYTGMTRGVPQEEEYTNEPRLNQKEKALHDFVSYRLQKIKKP